MTLEEDRFRFAELWKLLFDDHIMQYQKEMTEYLFSQSFPSLKGRNFVHDAGVMHVFNCYSDSVILECCLDKQKVKEAIEPIMLTIKNNTIPTRADVRLVWKNLQELGL